MLNDRATPLSLLETRRSGKPRDLVAPGPDPAQLARIIAIAARTPDHGKLAPWRFVEIVDRAAFADLLVAASRAERPEIAAPEVEARLFAAMAPTLVAVLSTPVAGKIPRWEQQLSAGAACMNLLHGAHALGYVGGWLTGWAAFSPHVLAALGGVEGDLIAGFVFIGTPLQPIEERPRPETHSIVRKWPVGVDG